MYGAPKRSNGSDGGKKTRDAKVFGFVLVSCIMFPEKLHSLTNHLRSFAKLLHFPKNCVLAKLLRSLTK